MPKWLSPLFSDIRNALGDSVVFSMWKGRPYFRQYVVPANPRTLKQQAHRDVMRKLVARWKEVIDTEDKKAAWNALASEQLISGYNLFIKEGRKSKISVPETAEGTGSAEVVVTYTLGFGAADARIYRYDGASWVDVTPEEGLKAGENQTFTDTVTASGTYYYFIADARVLVAGDTPPQPYQAITCWTPDEAQGVAKEAKCVVTIS